MAANENQQQFVMVGNVIDDDSGVCHYLMNSQYR